MLAAHAHRVFAPLPGVKQQFEREARLGAESLPCLELFDFGLSPSMKTLTSPLKAFHAKRRVAFDHLDRDGVAQEHAQHLQQVIGGLWSIGLRADDLANVPRAKSVDRLLAVRVPSFPRTLQVAGKRGSPNGHQQKYTSHEQYPPTIA